MLFRSDAIPPSRQTGRPTVQLQLGDVFRTGRLGRRQCDRLEKLTVHSSSSSQIKGLDETDTACGGHGQHRVKSQRMLFIDLTSQRTCRNHVELANQGCHEVPDREEDCDCHQCDDGQFPTAVSHQNFPKRKSAAGRVAIQLNARGRIWYSAGQWAFSRR